MRCVQVCATFWAVYLKFRSVNYYKNREVVVITIIYTFFVKL
jgi:hypothetical protein